MNKDDMKAFAVALAAANSHPDPHGYADKVLECAENPPPVPVPVPPQAPELDAAEVPAPEGGAPAPDVPAGDPAQ
jgi:hypothetical protein